MKCKLCNHMFGWREDLVGILSPHTPSFHFSQIGEIWKERFYILIFCIFVPFILFLIKIPLHPIKPHYNWQSCFLYILPRTNLNSLQSLACEIIGAVRGGAFAQVTCFNLLKQLLLKQQTPSHNSLPNNNRH